MESESQFFVPLAELAAAICRPKKTIENWLDSEGRFALGGHTIQTLKIGGLRVVARPVLDDLIRTLLRDAGVSPEAAARLVGRQPELQPKAEEVTSPSPALGAGAIPRRPGRPRKAVMKGGAA